MRTWYPRPESNVMDPQNFGLDPDPAKFFLFFHFLSFYFWSWFGSLSRWEPDILDQKAMLWIRKILVRIRILQKFLNFYIFLAFYFWSWFGSLSRWEPDFLDQKAMLWIRKILVRIRILLKFFYFFQFFWHFTLDPDWDPVPDSNPEPDPDPGEPDSDSNLDPDPDSESGSGRHKNIRQYKSGTTTPHKTLQKLGHFFLTS